VLLFFQLYFRCCAYFYYRYAAGHLRKAFLKLFFVKLAGGVLYL
jgi:hypothetical protein